MRVLNDKKAAAGNNKPPDTDLLAVLAFGILGAAGIATILLGPLPMLLSHLRLKEPWPKVAAVLGAVLAIMFLPQVPLWAVVWCFVLGLVAADGATRGTTFWPLLFRVVGVSVVGGAALILSQSLFAAPQVGIAKFWAGLIVAALSDVREIIEPNLAGLKWEDFVLMVERQSPFFYVSSSALAFWFSIGIGSHLGWFKKGPYAAKRLRKLQFPRWISLACLTGILASRLLVNEPWAWILSGISHLFGVLMFIQGTVVVSRILERRQLSHWARSVIYSLLIAMGFYVTVGLGLISEWVKVPAGRKEGRNT